MNQTPRLEIPYDTSRYTFAQKRQQPLYSTLNGQKAAPNDLINPLLALLVEESFDAMIVCDTEQHIRFWNRTAQELYGWSEDENNISELPLHSLLNSHLEHDLSIDVSAEISHSLFQSSAWQGELVQTRRDGRRLIVQSRHILVRDDAGQPDAIVQINRDITEYRQIELQNEKQMQLLSTASQTGFWTLNVLEDRTALSPVLKKIFPSIEGKLTRKQFLALVHPDDREMLVRNLQQVARDNKDYTCEFRVVSPLSGTHWLTERGCGLYNEQGQATHIVGVTMDITHTKQIEEELKATNKRITDILESISAAFFFLDTDWRYVYVNQQACKYRGKRPEELLGKSFWEVDPEFVGTERERRYRLAMETQQPIEYEALFEPTGDWVATRLSPTSQGLSVYSHDITERKQMEWAIQASEAKLRRLVDANIWPIVVASHSTGQILEANDAYLELVGYTREDLLAGKINWRKLTPPEYAEQDNQALKDFETTGIYRRDDKEYIHKSGKRVSISFVGAMLENSDELISFVTDLTSQKELEKQRTQFLSMISHELRGPLTGIRGSLQLAQRRLRRLFQEESNILPEIEKKRQDTTNVLENALRQTYVLDRLISDLIESARITSGQFTLSPQPCNLLQIVRETVEAQRRAIPDREISLELESPLRQDIPIVADADRIGQVLTNYILNAVKYSPPSEPIVVGLTMKQDKARVWVRDRGPGLSPDAQQRVWERFYRQPGTTDHSGQGVNFGLGLFICQTIITSHHGQVGVESRPEQGATFWFSLPLSVPTS